DWCVTCKANERRVLSQPAFRAALEQADAAYLVGDYTNTDPAITAFLDRHRAVGVPLYVVYPRGGGEGEVLPALLSDEIVTAALRRAAPCSPPRAGSCWWPRPPGRSAWSWACSPPGRGRCWAASSASACSTMH